ncbi:MAG: MMPL family transporter [Gammaproteobacteria bacterium]|nr:MMPL family transporter [Gammaproteobacteria bacterium]MBU1415996.1 MMPL family transporter [Gammaproteobacteria bacterium]
MTRSGRFVVALWLLGLAAFALVAWRGQFTTDMSAFLPQRPSDTQRLLVEQLREGSLSRLVLIGIEGADAPTRARLSKALAARLAASGLFTGVQNGDATELARDRDLLFNNRYLLSPAVNAGRFTVAGLREAIGESIDMLASPAGMMIKNLLPRDPTGEMMELIGAFAGQQGPASRDGVWASQDGKRALLMAQTVARGSDTDGQGEAVARVRAEFTAVADDSGAQLRVSGAPVFSLEARATIRSEVERLAIISAIGIITVLLLAYRSFTALTLGLLPVLSGALAGVAAVILGFGSIHGITIGFGATLIGESVDYSIYYFVQSRQGYDGEWRARFWPTIRLGVLTSLCGFASLLFSGFPGLAQLGLFSMSGLVVAALITRFVLPQLRPARFVIRDTTNLGRAVAPAIGKLGRRRWVIAVLAVAAVGVLVAHQDRLWNTRLSELSPMSPELLALDASLRADLGNSDQGYLAVVNAPTREAALLAAERVATRLQSLVDTGAIGSFESPSRFLPSQPTQQARRAALPERTDLAKRLQAALAELPLRADKLQGFLDDVEVAKGQPSLDAEALRGTSLGVAVDAMLQQRSTGWVALLPLHTNAAGSVDAAAVRAALASEPGALFLDLGEESTRLYAEYLDEAIWLSLAGFVAITLLLAGALRSGRRLLRVLTPLVLAVLLVMAALALVGERLTLLHLVGLLLAVAVGSNYALFFDDDNAAGDPRTLASLLVANATTVIGFGALATSTVPVLHAIGITVGPGAVLALILSAMLAGRKEVF